MAVHVTAHARLHLGQIDLHGGLGRRFGSIGIAVQTPRVIVEAQRARTLEVQGADGERAAKAAERFFQAFDLQPSAQIRVHEAIPAHVGLGSGTQLALGIGLALAKIFRISVTVQDLAGIMGRGARSGVGVGTFSMGGFVVDGGVSLTSGRSPGPTPVPPVVFHHPFPEDWWFVVAVPRAQRGLFGQEEVRAFAALPPMPSQSVGEICRLLVMKMLPALMERDIRNFGEALTMIQNIVGDFFASVQGGRFSTRLGASLIARMLELGANGAGQSSWGPTVYGLVAGEGAAHELATGLQSMTPPGEEVTVLCTPAANSGASLSVRAG